MGAGGAAYVRQQWDNLLPLMESGAIDPPIGALVPLAEVAGALDDLENRRATGKIVLHP